MTITTTADYTQTLGSPYSGGPWGGPWGGYGPAPYGGGPYGTHHQGPSAPVTGSNEIDELKRRIKALESQRQPQSSAPLPNEGRTMPPLSDGNSKLTFRPMGNE